LRVAERPPQLDIFENPDTFRRVLAIGSKPELQSIVHYAADQYWYWSDLKYRLPKTDAKPEEIWAFLKIGRRANRKLSPILDKKNEPFTYAVPDSLLREMSEIDKFAGGVLTADHPAALPSKERYIISSLMDEAIASSQLEGATTEYRVAKEMLRTGRKPKDKSEKMILNNWYAMQFIREKTQTNLSIEMLCELQNILTKDTLEHPEEEAGKLRNRDDIGIYYKGELVHEPPKHDALKEHMEKLCEFANNDGKNWVHPILKGAMIHFWIGYDHPFCDGNGRTARALMYWYMLRQRYALFQYLSISKHFLRAPARYIRAYVHSEVDENDLTYFLAYNLDAIGHAFRDLEGYLKRKQQELSDANGLLRKFHGLNLRQKGLIYHAIQHPDWLYTIDGHKNSHGISYETARHDLMQLESKGFLNQERQGKRLLVFIPSGKMIDKLKTGQAQVGLKTP